MNILVSSCLLGLNCRYDGKSVLSSDIIKLIDKHNLIPFCAEIYGGLPTPREPAEIIDEKVITKSGKDVTTEYTKGANQALKLCGLFDCKIAILKENSPSCGYHTIHNGKFDGGLIEGNGITAELLANNGIIVICESQINNFL